MGLLATVTQVEGVVSELEERGREYFQNSVQTSSKDCQQSTEFQPPLTQGTGGTMVPNRSPQWMWPRD